MLDINFWVWSSPGPVGLKFSGPSAKLLITLIIFNLFFVPIHSVPHTLAHVLIHQRKIDTDLRNEITKAAILYPQWISIVSSRTQTFIRKENPQHSFTCSFLKRLPLAILRLFQGFYHFLVRYKKKNFMHFSE